jgi:hypothetical protein
MEESGLSQNSTKFDINEVWEMEMDCIYQA